MSSKDTKPKKEKKTRQERLVEVRRIAKALKRMLGYIFKKSPYKISFYIITVIFISIIPFIASWLQSKVIDELVAITTQGSTDLSVFYYFIGFAILVMFLRSVNRGLNDFFEMNVWFDIARELTHDVTTKYANLDVEYYEDKETMDLLNKVQENYGHRPQQFTNHILWGLESVISIVSSISILVLFKPLFILILFITTIPRIVVNILYGRRSYGIWSAKGEVKRDYYRSRGHLMNENSLMELRVFRTRNYLLDRVYSLFYDFQKEQIKIANKRSIVSTGVALLGVLGYGSIFVITGLAVLALEITLGQFSFYTSTAGRLQGSLGSLFNRFSRMYESGLYVADMFDVLDFEQKIVSGEVCLAEKKEPPYIKLRNMTFKYPGTDKAIFDKLNLKIRPGEHVAIVGENGAGKSTLIKILLRFYDVTDGEILVDNTNLKDLDLENWYSKVGALFQDFNFYHFDAKTNIGVGNTELLSDFDRIIEAAKRSGAHDFIKDYENQYDQVLNKAFEGGIKPSIGQMQRIALARAFFKDAPILVLDEPTSAIDPKAEFEIFEQLFKFAEGKTVLIISHRFSTVRNADRIIVLDKGKIIEDGSHKELMQIKDGKYKTAFDLQKRGYE